METIEEMQKPVNSPDVYKLVRWRSGVLREIASDEGSVRRITGGQDFPRWFRFPVNLTTGQVVVPTLLFLADQCRLRRQSHSAESTLTNYAYDYCQWLSFLASENKVFGEADQQTFNDWIVEMAAEGEGLALAHKTLCRRASSLKQLYRDARSRSLAESVFSTRLAWDVGRLPEIAIRPIHPADIARLRNHLGPRPSELSSDDRRSSRLRPAFEIALNTGLRLFEIVALRVEQVRGRWLDCEQTNYEVPVRLLVTKGGVGGSAMFPVHLLQEIEVFLKREGGGGSSEFLFLNHAWSSRSAGRPMTSATLSADFRAAVRAADLMRPLPGAHRFGTGPSTAHHTFHDIRHTYAVMKLKALHGHVLDPWNEIRVLMRHESSETTKKVYLQHLAEFSAPIEEAVAAKFRELVR